MPCRLIWPFLLAGAAFGQTITNFAGNGSVGYQGDNGPATAAQVDRVVGLAADAEGNIYLADQTNHVVRKVDTSGIITTFAGAGAAGFSGDSGLATHAKLNGPQGICTAPSGVVYVTDTGNHRVRAVSTNGNITTVAGNGSTVSNGDSGLATSAGLNLPVRCAVDASGNLYIVDQGASVIRKVTIATGVITTFAGVNNSPGFNGDQGPAVAAQMNNPVAAILDESGNLFVSDQGNQRIRKIDTNGIISTVAGNGVAAFAGDLGDAKSASLNSPGEIAVDPLDNLFITDTSNQVIREVTAAGAILTVAGIPGSAGSGNGFGPLSAQFTNPLALTRDPVGNLYVSDDNHRVRKLASLTSGPPSCTYSLSWDGQAFPPAGGTGSVNITAGAGCVWVIPNIPSWIVITGYPANGGSGTVTYEVTHNAAGERSVTLTGNGLSYTIEQGAAALPGTLLVGSMAHLAAQENWTSTITLINKNVVPATARLSFFGDGNSYSSDPNGSGPLTLPVTFPQTGSSALLHATTFDRTLGSYASLIVETAGPQGTSPVLVGSAQLVSTSTVDGFTIFHQIPTGQEAVVPMETRKATSYLLAFDNTSGLVLGVAVENVTAQPAVIPVIVRNENGAVIVTQKTSISLDGNGHFQFVLADPATGFPETANIRGTIEFDTPPGGQISVLGLRFTPPNNALTTIPAMAQVGTGGGSIAHLASGGDGWQTTFVLVNAGATPASATLSFFSDQNGFPLTLPLAFPQSGDSSTAVSVSSYTTPQLAPGATLIIVTSGAPQLLTGSAQITSAGNVSGFVIFRHNNQEAVVPLESRNAQAYIIPFDNTKGTVTGIAVNAVSSQPVSTSVTIRNDAGIALFNDTITLASNGHYAFTLGVDRYQSVPNILNIRGTIEFLAPLGASIGALGIRIPVGAAPTYTTLPSLARQ